MGLMAAPVRRWNSEVWKWMVGLNVSNVSALAIMIAAFVITVLIVVDLDLAPGEYTSGQATTPMYRSR